MVRDLLLFAHVLLAITLVGPVSAAASAFAHERTPERVGGARTLHRMTRGYGAASLAVAVRGLALAWRAGWLGSGWVVASTVLFALATAVLFGVVLPLEGEAVASLERGEATADRVRDRLRWAAGVYSLLWAAVLWLMVAKPD